METFNSDGIFWLPENPNHKLTGRLIFNPVDGGTLDLMGTFDVVKSFSGPQSIDALHRDIILGVIANKEVTLYGCYETGSKLHLPGFMKSSYMVDFIFLGCNFEKSEEIIFESLSLIFTNLEDWIGVTGFNNSGKNELSYKKPDNIEIKLNNFDVNFGYLFNKQGTPYEYHLRQDTFVKIIPEDSTHFDEFLQKFCQPIQNFLSLGIGKAIYPLVITGKSEKCKFNPENGDSIYPEVLIFLRTRIPSLHIKRMLPQEMFFSLNDISDELDVCVKNWFEKAEDLKPIYDLYFGAIYNTNMYLEHSFLSFIQAIESYHRRMHDGKYLTDNDYENVYQTLLEVIPRPPVNDDHYQSLRSRIYYGNEYSLRTRLKNLFKDYEDLLNILIDDKNKFIDNIVNLRNYLTHYDKNLEERVKNGPNISILTQKMKFIVEVCLLVEIGISNDKIRELINRDQRYQRLRTEVSK